MSEVKVSGFTIVRNAVRLGYPFRESVLSALPLCDEFIIGCGDSDDGTREICEELVQESGGKVRFFDTVWERKSQSGGFQLKHQTDEALAKCRGKWCLYIQADEVFHEADAVELQAAMKKADGFVDVDGVLFRYVHFYGNYEHEIRGRNWYRREVRLFKNGRGIQAFRDAQGFRRPGDVRLSAMKSDARVFHYGYVRTPKSLGIKSHHMAQWWGNSASQSDSQSEEVPLRNHVGLRRFAGSHPAVMTDRIRSHTDLVDPSKQDRHWDWTEIKNAITLGWESVVPYRIGEFRNYEIY